MTTRLGVYCNLFHLIKFCETCPLRDLLDIVTIVFQRLSTPSANDWLKFIDGVFREENLGYRVDRAGGVHFFQDEEFERSRIASIQALSGSRYVGALEAYEEGYAALAGASPDTLSAVRRTFDAVENVFKMITGEPRLGTSEIVRRLKSRLALAAEDRSVNASKLLAESFSDWVNACHIYRHAPGEPDPSPPPLVLAIALISSGAAFLRWLVDIDMNTP